MGTCATHFLQETQVNKLKRLEACASSILNSNSCELKNEVDRHAVLHVRKCLNKDVCSNLKDSLTIN